MKYIFILFWAFHILIEFSSANTTSIDQLNENKTLIEKETLLVPAESEVIGENAVVDTSTGYLRGSSRGSLMGGYQLLSTWIPSRWAIMYTYIFSKQWSFEGEYSRGSWGIGAFGLDAFRITESRYSLLARRYWGNSFSWTLGFFKNEFHAKLGNDFLKNMSNVEIDDFRVQNMGGTVGMGNRWQWENGFTLGIDWWRVNVPLFAKEVDDDVLNRIEDNSDASFVKKWVRRVSNFPTFIFFGLNIGYTF